MNKGLTAVPCLRLLLITLYTCLSVPLFGQEEVVTAPVVGDIKIEYVGRKTISDEAVLARVQIREGMEYNQLTVDRSIRTLYQTQIFDFIEARTETMPNNEIRIIFSVQTKDRIESIELKGQDKIRRNRLLRDMESRVGGILDDRLLSKDVSMMLELYRERGFTQATVDYRVTRDAETGRGKVVFEIDEGPRLKIAKVEFVGNESISSRKLRKQMETRKRWFFSWLTGSGRFDEVKFQEDLERLRVMYLSKGFLDVSIPESNVTLSYPSKKKILIRIQIDEGRQYRVGSVSFQGNELYSSIDLYPALSLLPGDLFDPEKLDEDVSLLSDIYGQIGYLDAYVRPERKANVVTGDIDIVYHITEGDPFEVESIIVEGNTKTKSTVIIRELALAPGRTFNMVYMKNSEGRLKNSRYFDEVKLSPEPTDVPGKRNLKIRVREGRTGNLQFGAGFSTVENVTLFFEISQSNFDFFKWRSPLLQGDGQKFRLRGSIGSRSNEVVLYFEEPWLFEQRLAGGFELYRRESDYQSSTYDELRTGIQLFLRKRLIGLIDGQLSYDFEIVELKDVSTNAPNTILDESLSSPRSISKLTLDLVRDTRNDLIFTTRGSRFSLATSFAGLGGNTEYMKFESRNSIFIPTFETGDQVIQLIARAGTFWTYGSEDIIWTQNPRDPRQVDRSEVPFFERFYLGGPDSLRGFDYRDVGPADTSRNYWEPIGGKSYAFGSMEYTIKLGESLRLAAFYDWGFVNADDFDFSPTNYNDNWGLGIRLLVLGNPLRLDYGIPITSSVDDKTKLSNDTGGQFNFSFGTRF